MDYTKCINQSCPRFDDCLRTKLPDSDICAIGGFRGSKNCKYFIQSTINQSKKMTYKKSKCVDCGNEVDYEDQLDKDGLCQDCLQAKALAWWRDIVDNYEPIRI